MPSIPPRIPPRDTVASNILPASNAPGVDTKAAEKLAELIRGAIVDALEASNGAPEIDVFVPWEAIAKKLSLSTGVADDNHDDGESDAKKLSNATLRSALGIITNELLQKGYYNVVHQVIDDYARYVGSTTHDAGYAVFGSGAAGSHRATYQTHEYAKARDELRLRFAVAGQKRFDVDLETSQRLTPDRAGEDDPAERWKAFVDGQRRIIGNQNGMPERTLTVQTIYKYEPDRTPKDNGVIPDRKQAADSLLPPLTATGVDKVRARKLAALLQTKVIEALRQAGGKPNVAIELSWEEIQGKLGVSSADAVNNATLRAGLRPVIEELLGGGYYNLVYQIADDLEEDKDEIRLYIGLAGQKRFDVDWETSALLSSRLEAKADEVLDGGYYTSRGYWTDLYKPYVSRSQQRWNAFIEGQNEIIDNGNGVRLSGGTEG